MVKPEYLYGIIDNKLIEFEVIKEFNFFYGCMYYLNKKWHNKYISKDEIHKEYFLNYKRCEQVLKKKLKGE